MSLRTIQVALWALVAVVGLAAGALWLRSGSPESAAELGGPFELVATTGETWTEENLRGRPTAMFFGFTHCPDVCPTTVWEMEGWFQDLGPIADEVQTVFVTVDPERDTPERLAEYLGSQSDRIVGLSGDPEAVWDMARAWRVYWSKQPADEWGGYNVDHTTFVYLLDREGRYAGMIPFGAPQDAAVSQLRQLISGDLSA